MAKLKAEAARRKADEQRKAEEQRKADEQRKVEEQRKAEQERAADQAACEAARTTDTAQGWADYLKTHPTGECQKEATERMVALGTPTEPAKPSVEPPPIVPKPEQKPAPPPAEEPGLPALFYVGVAVSGAGIVVGTATGIVHLSQTSSLRDECPDDVCSTDKQEDIDKATTIGHVSTVGFAVAGAGAVLAVVALLTAGDGKEPAAELSAGLGPIVGPGFLGLQGRF